MFKKHPDFYQGLAKVPALNEPQKAIEPYDGGDSIIYCFR